MNINFVVVQIFSSLIAFQTFWFLNQEKQIEPKH